MKELCFKAILLCFCLLLGFNAFAYDAEIDGIYYNFPTDSTAMVTFQGFSSAGNPKSDCSGAIIIPENVTYDNKIYSVTAIGVYAFSGCRELTSITIPNSVTTIGYGAFKGSSNLTSITIGNGVRNIGELVFEGTAWYNNQPNGVVYAGNVVYKYKGTMPEETVITIEEGTLGIADKAFYNCSGITSITLPESVVSIGEYAFYGCRNLTSINIPEGITRIENYTFYRCSSLNSINIPGSVTSIGEYAFEGCLSLTAVYITDLAAWCNISFASNLNISTVYYYSQPLLYAHHLYLNGEEITDLVIPENVTSISNGAFWQCSGLTSISIPKSVTTIGDYAFAYCSGVISLTITHGMTSMGIGAFSGCTGLTSVTIPNSITSISSEAFRYCTSLTSVTIPENVTSIGFMAFRYCRSLTSLTIPNSVTNIGSDAFEGCSSLTSITIPNSVTDMGTHIFCDCTSLTSVNILDGITTISVCAFKGCTSLTTISIPNSVTSVGSSAFSGCTNLVSATIGSGVTSIGKEIFQGCKLRNLLVKCVAPPSIGTDAFSEQTLYHTTLYVPVGCWDAYAYDNTWYKFHNIRETATTEEEVSAELAFMLMDAEKFTYSVYDPVNDQINTINSVGINEDNPNHSWQMIEAGGAHFLYNIGAKKYVKRNGTRLEMTDVPEPIDVENGENGLVLGAQTAQQWALVSNEHMNVAQSAIDEVTGISDLNATVSNSPIYNLAGQRLSKMQKGINIRNGKKVLIK